MKRLFAFIFCCFLLVFRCYGQDIIFLKTGEEIKSKVKEVTPDEVRYVKFENLDGPTYIVLKSGVLMIKYENGQKDIFSSDNTSLIEVNTGIPVATGSKMNATAMYEKGIQDADTYYHGQQSGKTGVLLTSLLINGLVGLVPAVVCSVTPPAVHNLGIPNMETYRNSPEYATGYSKQAKKIKSKKIWKNWGIGTAISTVILIIAYSGG